MSSIAVKKQMDKLESLVGVKLLTRTNRGVSLTSAGETFLAGINKIEALSEKTLVQTCAASQEEKHWIRIGMSFLRPCQPLIDIWEDLGGSDLPFRLSIVSLGEGSSDINEVINSLGKTIDCFVAPCDSKHWHEVCNIHQIGYIPFRVAVPRTHQLAQLDVLDWDDMAGESLISPVFNDFPTAMELYDTILVDHPDIHVTKAPMHYDISTFNRCVENNCLMLAYDSWRDIHPSLVIKPVNWEYKVPFGVVYSQRPSPSMTEFIRLISEHDTNDAMPRRCLDSVNLSEIHIE